MGVNFDPNQLGSSPAPQLGGTGGVGGNASFGQPPPAAGTIPATGAASTQPAPLPAIPATGAAGTGPQSPTIDQQLYMALMGYGSDPSALTPMQRGGINTATGNFSGPGSFDNATYNLPGRLGPSESDPPIGSKGGLT